MPHRIQFVTHCLAHTIEGSILAFLALMQGLLAAILITHPCTSSATQSPPPAWL